jgi:hypothetical protein
MYTPIPGGTSMIIGEEDLAIEVHLPPVGKGVYSETGEVADVDILSRSKDPKEQYWERPEPPADYNKKRKREIMVQESDPDYVDDELNAYRQREWHRRLYGVWVMINGKPHYLTGLYYYYLTHWQIDIGPPNFRIADMYEFYFWQYCEEDPSCYGMVNLAARRAGKTFKSTCILTEFASRTAKAHVGIQSKTNGDAKGVFAEKLIQPFRKLPDFFKPKYDTSQGNVPKKELRFFEPSIRGRKGAMENYDDVIELESWIDFMPSVEIAYDGQKLRRYLCDEIFKTTEVDILKRHEVVKPCFEDSSRNIVGKAIYTSTVEEMEGHIERYIEIWNNSDVSKRNKNGKTKSGLYRYFTPVQKMLFLDKYGYPDEQKGLEWVQNEIESIDDSRAKAAFIRKNPRNWKEAFNLSADDCLYNVMKIDERLSTLFFRSKNYEKFKLKWDEDKKRVVKVKDKSGQFMFCWDFSDESLSNNVKDRGGEFSPNNTLKFVIGIDPIDHNRVQTGKFSNGAAAVYMKYDALFPDESENFVCLYVGRPPTAKEFWEEMVKLCHYFGCQMLFENNKPGIENHFKERGYGSFLIRDSKGTPGVNANEKTHQQLVDETEAFIEERCHLVNFPELLKDWKEFKMDDTTKYDLAMASGYALMAASNIRRKEVKKSRFNSNVKNTDELFRKYKIKKPFKSSNKWQRSLHTTSRSLKS